MYVVTQQDTNLPIENLDFIEENSKTNMKNGKLLPHSFRAAFCGPSGCGKTNALLSLLFNENGLRFENVYVYSKSLYQPKYKLLQDVLKKVQGVSYFPFKENDDVIDPIDAREYSIFIFDVSCDNQNKIREYFSMCRHKSIDAAYSCQTYSKIPKQLIRDNCNVIVLFKQDDTNLKHVFDEHASPFGFIVIVKECGLADGRYRQGFDKYIKLQQ